MCRYCKEPKAILILLDCRGENEHVCIPCFYTYLARTDLVVKGIAK